VLFGDVMCLAFVDASEVDIISMASAYMIANALFYIPLAAVNVYRFSIQGMGYSVLSLVSGVLEMIARAGVGMILIPIFGFAGTFAASPLAWVMADLFLVPAFHRCKNKRAAEDTKNAVTTDAVENE
jgi:Na+-driven multidrug efflux pump